MSWWASISDVSELPKAYPDETHIYTDADSYITYADVVTLSSKDEYVLSLISTSAALSMPLLTCLAADANHGDIQGTLPLLTASGQRNNFGNAEIGLPLLTANAEINSLVARLAVELPRMTVSAAATQANLVNLSKSLPMLKISGHGYQQNYGVVEKSLPAFTISASAYENQRGNAVLSLPAMIMRAEGTITRNFDDYIIKHDYDTWGFVKSELPLLTISVGAS